MPKLLFHVADTFQIEGRGLVVATDTRISQVPVNLQAGDRVEYRTLGSNPLTSSIKGLEFSYPFNPNRAFAFLAAEGITKADLAPGTEVWLISKKSGAT